jgi:hypothetical protein
MRKIQYAVNFIVFAVALILFLRFKFIQYILILFIYIAVISAIAATRFVLSDELENKLLCISSCTLFNVSNTISYHLYFSVEKF